MQHAEINDTYYLPLKEIPENETNINLINTAFLSPLMLESKPISVYEISKQKHKEVLKIKKEELPKPIAILCNFTLYNEEYAKIIINKMKSLGFIDTPIITFEKNEITTDEFYSIFLNLNIVFKLLESEFKKNPHLEKSYEKFNKLQEERHKLQKRKTLNNVKEVEEYLNKIISFKMELKSYCNTFPNFANKLHSAKIKENPKEAINLNVNASANNLNIIKELKNNFFSACEKFYKTFPNGILNIPRFDNKKHPDFPTQNAIFTKKIKIIQNLVEKKIQDIQKTQETQNFSQQLISCQHSIKRYVSIVDNLKSCLINDNIMKALKTSSPLENTSRFTVSDKTDYKNLNSQQKQIVKKSKQL